MSGFGAPGGIRTHNPWVRSLLPGMLFYVVRYDFRTSRPAHLRLIPAGSLRSIWLSYSSGICQLRTNENFWMQLLSLSTT